MHTAITTQQNRILATFLLVVVYIVNYLASSGMVGQGMLQLRETFPFAYMPEGRTFGVARGLIYLTLGVWIVWSWTPRGKANSSNNIIMPWFQVSCILNIIWIMATAMEYFVLSTIVIALLMGVLLKIVYILGKHKVSRQQSVPFGLYTGRIVMATMIIAISQFVYLVIDESLALSTNWTYGILAWGVFWATRWFLKYRNRAQLAITLIALIGIGDSMGVF